MPDHERKMTGVLGGILGLVGLSALAGVLVTTAVTPAVAVTSSAATSAISMFDNLPSVLTIDKLSLPTKVFYQDPTTKKEVVLARFYDQDRSPVQWDQIAPVMYDAILSSEDSRYYEHGGVDLLGTTNALISNFEGHPTRGGSSISQQYVKNVLIEQCEWNSTGNSVDAANKCWEQAAGATGTAGIKRKIQEMRYSIALEQKYSKNEILLGYLNIALFGGNVYGINAASKYYFGIPAANLSTAQAATLAGMVQNPNTYRIDLPGGTTTINGKAANTSKDKVALVKKGDYYDMVDPTSAPKDAVKLTGYSITKERQLYVLGRMLHNGKITQTQYDQAATSAISPHITQPSIGCTNSIAPYFCQYVRNTILNDKAFGATATDRGRALERGGLKIYTTLDPRVAKAAQGAEDALTPTHLSYMDFGSASVSLQTSTGRVLSMVQNTRYTESSNQPGYTNINYSGNDANGGSGGFNAGSTFKLFTLLTWLDSGHSLTEIVNGNDVGYPSWKDSCKPNGTLLDPNSYIPGNFAGDVPGYGTPMYFTKISLNSGFWGMAHELDLCKIGKMAGRLGVTLGTGQTIPLATMSGQPYEILGSDNVSPIQMAAAYATVANKGVYCQPKVIDKVTDNNGNLLPIPKTTCTQVIDPKIAAAAAYALKGPMSPGGTGYPGNPQDGTPLIGKTGTHQSYQTWLNTSSTAVTTSNWVGAVSGQPRMDQHYYNGMLLWNIRYPLARDIQAAIDRWYPGSSFPTPDSSFITGVQGTVPNVVGMTQAQAIQVLISAGFGYVIGPPVDSALPAGTIASQGPGRAPLGTRITINPSNGVSGPAGGSGNGNNNGNSPGHTPSRGGVHHGGSRNG